MSLRDEIVRNSNSALAEKAARFGISIDEAAAAFGGGGSTSPSAASDEFLRGFEWRQVRMFVLKRDGAKCRCCGATPATGAVMNVDHIKPRKTHPQLALDPNNCQVLCNTCNHGKGNWDSTEWPQAGRPKTMPAGPTSPYLAIIRYLLQRPALAALFNAEPPQFPSREAQALDVLLTHIREQGSEVSTGPLIEALQNTEFAAIYRKTGRLIADIGDTGESDAEFADAVETYRAFEANFAKRREMTGRADE